MQGDRLRDSQQFQRFLNSLRKHLWATQTLVVIIAASIGPQMLIAGLDLDGIAAVRAGGTASWLLREGDLFRLVTASFVHSGTTHLFLNLLLVSFVGAAVEQRMGGAVVLIVALAGGVAGFVTANLASPLPAVGASAMALALLGTYSFLSIRKPGRERIVALVILAGLIAEALGLTPALVPGTVTHSAHLGAFATGFLMLAVGTRPRLREILTRRRRRRIAAALVLLYAAFAWWGYEALVATSDSDIVASARTTLLSSDSNPGLVYGFSRGVYTRSDLTPAARETALLAMTRLVDRFPENAEYRHLLFHLLERQEGPGAADEQIRAAFALAPTGHTAEHIAAIELRELEERSPGSAEGAAYPTLAHEIAAEGRGRLDLDSSALGCRTDLLALHADAGFGLLRIELGTDAAPPTAEVDLSQDERLPEARWRKIASECRGEIEPTSRRVDLWIFE